MCIWTKSQRLPKWFGRGLLGVCPNVKLGRWNTPVMWTFEATDWSRKKSPLGQGACYVLVGCRCDGCTRGTPTWIVLEGPPRLWPPDLLCCRSFWSGNPILKVLGFLRSEGEIITDSPSMWNDSHIEKLLAPGDVAGVPSLKLTAKATENRPGP